MEVISRCALRVAKVVWRPGHGGFAFTVVCKATFDLQPELSRLSPVQDPVIEADLPAGAGGAISAAAELLPFKVRPEVILTGHAYAPEGTAVPSLVARLVVGDIDKALQVIGDCHFAPDGRLGESLSFARMPLGWDRAAGGPGTDNPAGRALGAAARIDPLGRVVAPNLLPARLSLRSRADLVPAVGFGPIAPRWPSRLASLHRHAIDWDPERWQERPLPADLDLAYFNAAPLDQQRATPFGEETIQLKSLHPRFAFLQTRLEPVTPVATVEQGAGLQPLQLRCDTLVIDTDRGLAMLVWRGHVLLDHPDRPGVIFIHGPGAARAAGPARKLGPADATTTLAPSSVLASIAPLPFAAITPASPGPLATPPAPVAPAIEPALSSSPRIGTTTLMAARGLGTETLGFGIVLGGAALPFASFPAEEPSSREALPSAPGSALPFRAPVAEEALEGPPTPRLPELVGPLVSPAPPESSAPLAALRDPPFEPPRSEPQRSEPQRGEPQRSEPVAVAESTLPEEAPQAEIAGEIDFDSYPPARCGAIAARVACDQAGAADILRAEGLDVPGWERVHAHWLARIAEGAARGRKKLLSEHDSAYVEALEALRGAIGVEKYAQLAEAAQRDGVTELLVELDLPEEAWPHIHRVWIGRIVKDAQLGKQVRGAIACLQDAG